MIRATMAWHSYRISTCSSQAGAHSPHVCSSHRPWEWETEGPSISQHGDSSWDAMRDCTQMFPYGSCCYHPMVVSSEDVADSETSIKITGVQESNLGNGQISPAKAVCGSTNWRAGDISFCCFFYLIFILQRQFMEGLSLWYLSRQMWKRPAAWHMFSLSRNSLRWENLTS